MILVTGAAGFIGSNLVHALNERGERDLFLVDSLERGTKYRNLLGARFRDLVDKADFAAMLQRKDPALDAAQAVFHLGACSSTTEWNGRYLLENNYRYSKHVLSFCERRGIPLVYASSAAVYGATRTFREERENEGALNAYGWSKQIFDDHVRDRFDELKVPVVGLRYFNVYGPREAHKGPMASVVSHFYQQLRASGRVRLFGEHDGFAAGDQQRDFVHVDDVVQAHLFFLDARSDKARGIFNVGTGTARSFNAMAAAVMAHHGSGTVEYIPFPEQLRSSYQSFTQANLDRLRAAGFAWSFQPIEQGVASYCRWIDEHPQLHAVAP